MQAYIEAFTLPNVILLIVKTKVSGLVSWKHDAIEAWLLNTLSS